MKARLFSRWVLPLSLFLFLIFLRSPVRAQTASYSQLSFIYGPDTTSLTDWGAMDLGFTGFAGYKYLNLQADTAWAIENMVVYSVQGTGVSQSQRFWFPLPDSGIVISTLAVGFTLTDSLKTVPPSLTDTISVFQKEYVISPGSSGGGGGKNEASKARKQAGGAVAFPGTPAPTHATFPNQETEVNECCPSAISNSLNYLNSVNPALGLPAQAISVDSLKQKLNWMPASGVDRETWVGRKRGYTQRRKLPISTINGGSGTIIYVQKLLADKQDVEIDAQHKGSDKAHVMSVVNCIPLADGKFQITVRHDAEQGKPGGLVTENGIFDPKTGDLTGALSSYKSFFIVVECPVPPVPQTSAKQPKPGKSIKSSGGISNNSGGIPATANNEQLQLRNMVLNNFSDSIAPPALGARDTVDFVCNARFEISLDTGSTFTYYTATATCRLVLFHTENIGPASWFETEMLQMDLSGGSLPSNISFRESPSDSSTGLIRQIPMPGGIISEVNFLHLRLEYSTNSGGSWNSFDNVLLLEGDNTTGTAAIPLFSNLALIVLGLSLVFTAAYFIRNRMS